MSGVELEVENLISEYIKGNRIKFIYFECGFAEGFTFKAVSDIIRKNIKHDNWKAIGLDLVNGYSLNFVETAKIFNKKTLQIFTEGLSDTVYLKEPNCQLLLWENPREYTRSLPNNSIDIALVDGNHNLYNVTEDFLSLEDKVKIGGLVMFHDFGEIEQNTDLQAGGGYIEVRQACKELGLLDNSRKNWKFIKEIPGSRVNGTGDGNSMGVFQKVL